MTARSRSKFVVFSHPFELKGVDRILPPGDYRVVTDEVLIEELSFPVYRRISTMIFLPRQGRQVSSLEMMTIDPRDLEAAQGRDARDREQCNESTTGGECEQASDRNETRPHGTHANTKPSILITPSRNGGSDVHGSPSTVGVVPASKKALQLRQDQLKTQMVAAQRRRLSGAV